jgi:hypothetical protein
LHGKVYLPIASQHLIARPVADVIRTEESARYANDTPKIASTSAAHEGSTKQMISLQAKNLWTGQ